MNDSREHDAVRPAADDRINELIFPRFVITYLSEYQLIAIRLESMGQRIELMKSCPESVGTRATTSRLLDDRRPPAIKFGT